MFLLTHSEGHPMTAGAGTRVLDALSNPETCASMIDDVVETSSAAQYYLLNPVDVSMGPSRHLVPNTAALQCESYLLCRRKQLKYLGLVDTGG